MELSERFMRVSASGVSRVEPSIEIDGSWEVEILDTYLDIPNESEEKGHLATAEKTYGKELLCEGPMDFVMRYEVRKDKLLGEGDCRWSRSSNVTTGRIMLNSGLKKGTAFVAVEKGSFHTNVDRGRFIDIECDLLESNYISGIPGKILKTLHEGTPENMSEIYRESKHPTDVPLAITEFNTIRIRLLNHSTGEPVKYNYSSTTGRPYMSVALQPT